MKSRLALIYSFSAKREGRSPRSRFSAADGLIAAADAIGEIFWTRVNICSHGSINSLVGF